MLDDFVRPRLPRYAGPALALYARLGVTPDQVTLLGLALAILAAFAVARGHGWAGLALWWASRAVDGTDGLYARQSGQATSFGAYLDILADMAAYGAMVLGLAVAWPGLRAEWLAILFLYVLCITSALALGAQEERLAHAPRDDRGLRLGAGLAEGGETGIAYSIFLIFPQQLALTTKLWIAVLALTVVLRTILARRLLREPAAVADAASSPGSHTHRM
jgi:phosphatidylglycerophosphate synthase